MTSTPFTLVNGGVQDCALVSSTGYDLTGNSVFAALASAPSTAGQTFSYLRAAASNGDNVEVAQAAGTLVCAQNIGTTYTALASVPYDPVMHKFWRLAEAGGTLGWQTSPDGATWTTQLAMAPPISLVGVDLSIGAGTNSAVASPGAASFSTFDTLPE